MNQSLKIGFRIEFWDNGKPGLAVYCEDAFLAMALPGRRAGCFADRCRAHPATVAAGSIHDRSCGRALSCQAA